MLQNAHGPENIELLADILWSVGPLPTASCIHTLLRRLVICFGLQPQQKPKQQQQQQQKKKRQEL